MNNKPKTVNFEDLVKIAPDMYRMLKKLQELFFPHIQYIDKATYIHLQMQLEDLIAKAEGEDRKHD